MNSYYFYSSVCWCVGGTFCCREHNAGVLNSNKYSQRLGSEEDNNLFSKPHWSSTYKKYFIIIFVVLSFCVIKVKLIIKNNIETKNTMTDLEGPFQHNCPLSYFILEYLFSSGPAHEPQRLKYIIRVI